LGLTRNILSRLIWATASLLSLLSQPAAAEHFIIIRPAAVLADTRDEDIYEIGLLKLALAHADGEHTMETAGHLSTQGRGLRSLADGTAPFHVYYSGYSATRERDLSMVYVPLSRGLLGHRMLVVRADIPGPLLGVHSVEGMKRLGSFGSGATWPDTRILRHAGFHVLTGVDDQLWHMLERGRFSAFPRGMQEVIGELQLQKERRPDVPFAIHPRLMIAYPFDMFFFTAPDDRRRADIIEQGLKAAYDTGAFMDYFENHPATREALAEFHRHPRRIFRIDNPLLSDKVRTIPEHYWLKLGE
jgi:hypothetical protein